MQNFEQPHNLFNQYIEQLACFTPTDGQHLTAVEGEFRNVKMRHKAIDFERVYKDSKLHTILYQSWMLTFCRARNT